MTPKLVGLLLLGGLQGAVGWWMVASGLVDRVDVSQYRLATHLTLACLIFAADHGRRARAGAAFGGAGRPSARSASPAFWCSLVLIQIFLGGLVAGLDAGMSYNTWPLMDGAVVPGDLFVIEPAWRNFFENPKTVQFVHRAGPMPCSLLALWHMIATRPEAARHDPCAPRAGAVPSGAGAGGDRHRHAADAGAAAWALLHQGMALVVLGFAAAHWRGTKGSYPLPTDIAVRLVERIRPPPIWRQAINASVISKARLDGDLLGPLIDIA